MVKPLHSDESRRQGELAEAERAIQQFACACSLTHKMLLRDLSEGRVDADYCANIRLLSDLLGDFSAQSSLERLMSDIKNTPIHDEAEDEA